MYHKTAFKKRLLALALAVGMLNSSIGITTCLADATPQENSISKAVNWLNANQNEDGSWGKSDISFIDTSEVSDYIAKNNIPGDSLQRSSAWMEGLEVKNNDIAARIYPFIKNVDKHTSIKNDLLKSQNIDGGWGIAEGYESDVLDTVLILNALLSDPNTESTVMQKAAAYLINAQRINGSWSFNESSEPVTSLTARTAITLSLFQSKTNLTSTELQTSMRKAGEYLVSIQKSDKTWGTDETSIVDTLLSYRAVLDTVGTDAVDTVDTSIINAQGTDGSWYGSPYITALAIESISEHMNMPYAKINSIKLLKNVDGTKAECYSYNAYDTFEIQVDGTYSNTDAKLLYFVRQKDGNVFSAQTDGLPGWNTKNSVPGDYSVIVQVKDNNSGRIIAEQEKPFVINPTFEVGNVMISTDPEDTRVNNPCDVNTEITLVTNSNIDKTLNMKTSVLDGTTVIKQDERIIETKASDQIAKEASVSFTPDVSVPKDYVIRTEIYDGTDKLTQYETVFKVLPPPSPTRIDASQGLNKEILYPGSDSVTAQFKLDGVGTPEMPQRNPVDLILCIDDSGSMEWGNNDWSSSKPWRIDFAKDAAKRVIDLLQTQDRGAVVEFAGGAWIQKDLTGDKDLLKTGISQTPSSPWDGTDIALGLSKSMGILDQKSTSGRDKVIVLLSDGGSDRYSAITKANQAKAKGYKIYSIALGAGADQYLMSTIAQITQGKYAYSPTMEQLDSMMNILAGDIFDTAGKSIVLESTIPENGMTVDASKIMPSPTSITNNSDGTKTIRWTLDRVVMGQEKQFEISFDGTNLISDTEIMLTKDTKLTYLDRNNTSVTVNMPDLKIPVNKYLLDSRVNTDKSVYTADENVNITNTAKNLTDYPATLTGKAEITDANGNLVKLLTSNIASTWNVGESKTMDFSWNTGKTITGTYKARITWSEGDKVISVAESSFTIAADKSVSDTVTVDKQKYTADDEVNISEIVKNDSTNNIEKGLSVKTSIKDPEGKIIWNSDNMLNELLPTSQISVKNIWNTAKNAPGQYVVTMEVYRGDAKVNSSSAAFEIVSDSEGIMGVSGSLQVLQKNIYPADAVGFSYTVNNTGNVKLSDITARIRIIDTATKTVLGTITDKINIDVSSDSSSEKIWTHETLKTGTYMVILDAILSDGNEIPLASSYINVENPYDTTINQVVRPRVLVWAESQCNIDLAKKTLDDMQVYSNIVNNRDDFMAEMRTDKYNLYMLLDSKLPLTGNDDSELTAEIARGKGIIASRDADGDNLKNMGLFGVKFRGSTTPKDYSVDFSADSIFGQLTLSGTGKAQYVVLDGGQQIATLNSKKGTSPGVVINKYQSGNSLLFTFDIGSCTGDTESVLRKAVQLTTPVNETNDGYAEIEIKIKAYTAIGAEAKLNIPEGAEVIWTSPEHSGWNFDTVKDKEYTFRAIIKLPQTAGQYPVTVDTYYDISEGMYKFNTVETMLTRIQ